MARDILDGTFILQNNPKITLAKKVFCKINEMHVITSPAITDRRYVAYSVKAWVDSPDVTEEISVILGYNGVSVFYTEIGYADSNVYEIENICKDHFTSKILKGYDNRNAEIRLHELSSVPMRGLGFSLYVEDNLLPVTSIKRFWHKASYTAADDTASVELSSSTSNAITSDNELSTISLPFSMDVAWFRMHCQHLVEPGIFKRQRFSRIT